MVEFFEDEFGEKLDLILLKIWYRGKLELNGDKLILFGEMISEMFKFFCESIVEYVESFFVYLFCKDVDKILMVGGFFECVII